MIDDFFISSVAQFSESTDVKALITDAIARRRMSRLIKMGVAVGLQCLQSAGLQTPDAIVTASGFGFLADSEKLLRAIISSGESALSPTPFMQSTFNTIGSHLAIFTGCSGYNMAFSQRFDSLRSALIDSAMLLNSDCRSVLLVAADELTPSLAAILRRFGAERHGVSLSEGATAFLLTSSPSDSAIARLHFEGEASVPCHFPADQRLLAYPTADADLLAHLALCRQRGSVAGFSVSPC